VAVEIAAIPGDVFPQHLIRKTIPFILLAVLVYVAVFFFFDAAATFHQFGRVSPRCIVVAVQFALGSFLLRAVRWHYYLRISDVRVPPSDSLLIFLVGLLLSLTPGKMGEVMKSLLLKEGWQVPVARTAPIVLAERITDLASVLLLGGVGLLAMPGAHLAGAVGVLAASALLAVCTIRPLGRAVIAQLARVAWVARRRDKLVSAHSALTGILGAGPLVVAMALACGAWGLQSMCAWVIAGGFPDTHLTLGQSLVVSCGPLLAGALALVPGGLGATEASMTGLLVALGGPDMSPSEAAAITVLFRIVTLWLAVCLGFLALVLWRARRSLRGEVPELGREPTAPS
jgi:uncharacterized membrane protein YbhN (UPF0104 family)